MLNELFEKWLQTNQDRFRYKPIKAGSDIYKFEGIIENIYLKIQEDTKEGMILFEHENGETYDHISLGYLEEVKYIKGKGYTDLAWADEHKSYFPTYEEMVYATIFEPIVAYCDKYFIGKNTLYLVEMDTATFGLIGGKREEDEIQKLKETCTNTINNKPSKYEIYKYDIFANKGIK